MPKCLDCGNEFQFLVSYVQYESLIFNAQGESRVVRSTRYRTEEELGDNWKPVCCDCDGTNIEGEVR